MPPLVYLQVRGEGDPNTAPAFAQAIGALYGMAYALAQVEQARREAMARKNASPALPQVRR